MNVAVLLFPEVHELDAVGPYSAVNAARHFVGEDDLTLYTVAASRRPFQTSGGLTLTSRHDFTSAPPPDVLIIPGGRGVDGAAREEVVTGYVLEHASRAKLLVSVCTGAFLLGEAGLLRGLRANTWAGKRERLLDYGVGEIVDARVVKNDRVKNDGVKNARVWCAGGVSAGIDAGLEVVEELYGAAVAEKAAVQINYPFWARRPENTTA